jgi:hypothetical protein
MVILSDCPWNAIQYGCRMTWHHVKELIALNHLLDVSIGRLKPFSIRLCRPGPIRQPAPARVNRKGHIAMESGHWSFSNERRANMNAISKAALSAILAIGLYGCDQKGPAEEAGESLDDAADTVEDQLDERGPAEKAGEAIDDAVDEAGEKVEDAGEKMQQ